MVSKYFNNYIFYFLKKKVKSKLENQKSTKINVEKRNGDFYLGNFIFLFYGVRNKMF
jgi:hypothetical protein